MAKKGNKNNAFNAEFSNEVAANGNGAQNAASEQNNAANQMKKKQ